MQKRVEVIFNRDGSVTVDAKNFQGQACEKATEFLEKIFGSGERKYKDSYYQEEEVKLVDGLPSGFCG